MYNKVLHRINALLPVFLLLGAAGLLAFTPAMNVAEAQDVDQTIEITGTDQLTFSVTEIEASPGETIQIVLTTESTMPPESMSHNVAVVEPSIDLEAFVNASAQAADSEYIAPEFEDEVIAYTEMIGGGETSEVTFTVPEEPGEYPFVCTFPGHYLGGMEGTLTVQ